jgi:hypothetical protein
VNTVDIWGDDDGDYAPPATQRSGGRAMKWLVLVVLAAAVTGTIAAGLGGHVYRWELLTAYWSTAGFACAAWSYETKPVASRARCLDSERGSSDNV